MFLIGNPGLRHGKPGNGVGVGYGVRVKFPMGHFQVDYALNDYQQKTIYFGFSNVASWFTLLFKRWVHLDFDHYDPKFQILNDGQSQQILFGAKHGCKYCYLINCCKYSIYLPTLQWFRTFSYMNVIMQRWHLIQNM